MSAVRTAYTLLALDLGAIWGCLVVLLAAWLDRRAARSALAADAASAVTSLWQPGWEAPTAPMPTVAATDPWADAAAAQPPTLLDLPAVQPGHRPGHLARPDWDAATSLLPRVERRRLIDRPRNDAPAAAQPRYIEMELTWRR